VLGHAVEPPPDVRAVGRVEPNEPLPGLRKAVVFGDVVIPRRGPRARLWGGARVKVKGAFFGQGYLFFSFVLVSETVSSSVGS
jgi:hypothetical protein